DMFPLISYIALKGRCRVCKERISIKYPIVEGLNALLWIITYITFGFTYLLPIVAAFLSILIIIVFIDLDIMEIPNGLVIALFIPAIVVFALSFFNIGSALWWEHLIGMVAVSGLLFIIALITKGGIGGGDIKLMLAAGLMLGWKKVAVAFFIGIIIGAVIGITLVLFYGKSRKAQMPLAPSLAIGIATALLFGDGILAFLGY
ncbi:MAG: prepilin peptidase, partial [Clostridia bacterium]|nr:prepilin peptidase [Clostridia bacterium]